MHRLSANQHTNCVTASSSPFMNSTHTSVLSIQINPLTFFRFSRLFGLFVGRSGQIYIYIHISQQCPHTAFRRKFNTFSMQERKYP